MQNQIAIFGGGCFWCTEAVFKMLKGVVSLEPGYAGGKIAGPTYDQVCGGDTDHVEVIKIEYDPAQIAYTDLLTVFFGSHDPTTVNRQGNDVGTQYRSVIFYTNEEQKRQAEDFIKNINSSNQLGAAIATSVEPLATEGPAQFWPAENYHHDYFAKNPGNRYCEIIINPKLEKVQKEFSALLKNNEN